MNTIDLHMHSQYSIDGEFSVKELCEQANHNGLRVMAIADHNRPELITMLQIPKEYN